jgi:hypothetical protein
LARPPVRGLVKIEYLYSYLGGMLGKRLPPAEASTLGTEEEEGPLGVAARKSGSPGQKSGSPGRKRRRFEELSENESRERSAEAGQQVPSKHVRKKQSYEQEAEKRITRSSLNEERDGDRNRNRDINCVERRQALGGREAGKKGGWRYGGGSASIASHGAFSTLSGTAKKTVQVSSRANPKDDRKRRGGGSECTERGESEKEMAKHASRFASFICLLVLKYLTSV